MVPINKGVPPKELTQYKCTVGSTYDSFPDKDKVKESLEVEQHGLCAYCMGKLYTKDRNEMKIEHFKCQSRYPAFQLDYSNMLGCCDGGQGKAPSKQTCDTHKADMDFLFNPANATDAAKIKSLIRYCDDGTIYSTDKALDNQLNDVLNLNFASLVKDRKGAIEVAKALLNREHGTRSKEQIQKVITYFYSTHSPFYGAAVYYLETKLGLHPKP